MISAKTMSKFKQNKKEQQTNICAESITSKQIEEYLNILNDECRDQNHTNDNLIDKVINNLDNETFNHQLDLKEFQNNFCLTYEQAQDAICNNQWLKNNHKQRRTLIKDYPNVQCQDFINKQDKINFAKQIDQITQVSLNECRVGKYHKYEYLKVNLDHDKTKFKNNNIKPEDLFKKVLNDQQKVINYSHQFSNDSEINLTKKDKLMDNSQFDSTFFAIDDDSAVIMLLFNISSMVIHILQLNNYPDIRYQTEIKSNQFQSAWLQILLLQSIQMIIKFQSDQRIMINSNLKQIDLIQEQSLIIKITLVIAMLDIKLNINEIAIIFASVCLNQYSNKEKMHILHTHYLNSLINLIRVALPFGNHDTEFIRLKYWVHQLSQKLNQTDVYNQLFDVCMTQQNDHLYLNQSQYLKYRSKCNIYHKRIIRNQDMLYPRPVSQQVFKNYNLTSKGKFHNLISGKGVPLPYNWWLKAKNTIQKTFKNREKLARVEYENQKDNIDKDKEKFLFLNEEIIKKFFLKTEKLNIQNLDLKKKIHMTLPVLSEDQLDKDSAVESEEDDQMQAEEKEMSKNDSQNSETDNDNLSNQGFNHQEINNPDFTRETNQMLHEQDIKLEFKQQCQNEEKSPDVKNGSIKVGYNDEDKQYLVNNNSKEKLVFNNESQHSLKIRSLKSSSVTFKLENDQANGENGNRNSQNELFNKSSKSKSRFKNNNITKSIDIEKNNLIESIKNSSEKFKEQGDSDIREIEDIYMDINSENQDTDKIKLEETQKSLENLKNKKHFKQGNLF